MQAIQTKFIGPTNHRGSRIKATCAAKSITVSWDHAIGADANHIAAARALADSLGWTATDYAPLMSGTLADQSMVHVMPQSIQFDAAYAAARLAGADDDRASGH